MKIRTASVLLAALNGACGGAAPEPQAPTPDEAAVEPAPAAVTEAEQTLAEASAPSEPTTLPTACHAEFEGVCVAPPKFTKALCEGDFPTVAVAMMASGTPWTRAYVTTRTQAWNATGGASSPEELEIDE
ncbi:MAG: hypothetical protein AAGA56_04750, partial [Myxococcota bacterium]